MKKTVIGIDPGASGGIAVYKDKLAKTYNMPSDTNKLNDFLKYLRETNDNMVVFLEKVNAFRGDVNDPGKIYGINRMLDQYSSLTTLLKTNNIPYMEVYPVSWQSKLGLASRNVEKKDRKEKYLNHAQRMFPEVKATLKTADALCLLNYGMIMLIENPEEVKPKLIGVYHPDLFKQ